MKLSLQDGQKGAEALNVWNCHTPLAYHACLPWSMSSRAAALDSAKQAVKTAIAGVISLYLTDLFHLPEGYWAAISALIVMQSNVGATLSASRTRLAGTAVGAVVGGLFAALYGMNTMAFALAVAIAFFVCDSLHLAESQRLATVTVAIIMLIGRTSSAWIIALHRFAEVALGILIALLVSLTLWPNHARRSVRRGLVDALLKVGALYRAIMRGYLGQPVTPLEASGSIDALKSDLSSAIHKNDELLQFALQEAFGPLKERESLALLANQVQRIFHATETLEFAVCDSSSDAYFRKFETGTRGTRKWGDRGAGNAFQKHCGWEAVRSVAGSVGDHCCARRAGGPRSEVRRNHKLSARRDFALLFLAADFTKPDR